MGGVWLLLMGGTAFATLCLYGIHSGLEWGCALASIREYETEKAAAMGLSITLSNHVKMNV